MFIQFLLNGLTMGSIYAILAICTTIIFKSMGVLDFARGDMVMIAAFICLTLIDFGINLYLAILLAMIISVCFGLCLERFIYRRLNYDATSTLLIATVGMQIILRNSAQIIWGSMPKSFPSLFPTTPWVIGGVYVLPQNVGIIATCLLMVVLLQLFYKRTRIGKMMVAASSDRSAAQHLGVNITLTRFLTFGISSLLAALAAVLVAPSFNVYPTMGGLVGSKAFAAAIIGGFGNISGALVGGLLLGIVEALGAGYISFAYKDAFSFVLLILVLYIKPTGFFAKRVEQKF